MICKTTFSEVKGGFEAIVNVPLGISITVIHKNVQVQGNPKGKVNFQGGLEANLGYMFQIKERMGISLLGVIGYSYTETKYSKYNDTVKYKFIDNDLYCHPISFPIYGKYSDYGEFCDYEKEANVEILEKHFGLSIEDIIQTFVRIGDDGYVDADKESEILKHLPIDTDKQSLTLCVEHKAIYDRIGDIFNPKVIDFNKISCFTLEELGFIRTSCKDLGIKYDRQYSEFETLYMFPNNALNNTYLLKDVDGFFSVLKRSDEDDKFYKEFRFKIPNKKYESIFISCVKDLLEFSEHYIGLKFDIHENSPLRTMRFYNFNFIKSAEIYNRKGRI